jgi:hypothetical protein
MLCLIFASCCCGQVCQYFGGTCQSQSQSYVMTDSQSASPSWCQDPSGTRDQFFFLLEIIFRQLRVCYFVAPSLMSGRICNLLLLLVLTIAVLLGSESRRTQDHILLFQFLRHSPTWRARSPYLYPPETGWPRYTPDSGFPFHRLLRLAGLQWRYSIPPPHRKEAQAASMYSYFVLNSSTESTMSVLLFLCHYD